MATITISGSTILPSMRAMVAFVETAGAGTYTLTLTAAGHTTVTATGTASPIWVSTALDYGITYTAAIAKGTDTGTGTVVATGTFSRSQILRQQIADLIRAAAVTDAGARSLTILSDANYAPRCMRESDAPGQACPFVEILHPRLTGTRWASGIRQIEQYEARLRVIDAGQDEDSAVERVLLLADKIRNAIDTTDSLSTFGIVDNSWSWAYAEPVIDERLTALEISLQMQVQAIAGVLPYSA